MVLPEPPFDPQPSYPFRPPILFEEFLVHVEKLAHPSPKEAALCFIKCQLEVVRIFTWSIVQRLQEVHQSGECVNQISPETVVVGGSMGFLTSVKVGYSEVKAVANYKELHDLLSRFDCEPMPYCWTNFLSLLLNNPLQNKDLIARHFGILSDHQRLSFCKHLVILPRTMKRSFHEVFFAAIDSVDVAGDLDTSIKSKEEEMIKKYGKANKRFVDRFETLQKLNNPKRNKRKRDKDADKDAENESDDEDDFLSFQEVLPPQRSFWLVRKLRNMLTHLGTSKRTPIKYKSAAFKAWLKHLKDLGFKPEEVNARKKRALSLCVKKVYISKFCHKEFISLILEKVPTFYCDIQLALDKHRLLKHLCINPSDMLSQKVYGRWNELV